MITTLEEGITIHGDAEGAIVQSVKVTNKKEKVKVSGMVSGKTQIVRVFDHSETNEFEVTGKGDFTFVAGVTDTEDLNIDLLSGGVSMVDDFMYEQKIGEASDWSYKGEQLPHAA